MKNGSHFPQNRPQNCNLGIFRALKSKSGYFLGFPKKFLSIPFTSTLGVPPSPGIRGSRRESKRKQRLSLHYKRVSFLKNTSSFSFSPFHYSRTSNLGKIYANFSGEVVTSLSVLDHRV